MRFVNYKKSFLNLPESFLFSSFRFSEFYAFEQNMTSQNENCKFTMQHVYNKHHIHRRMEEKNSIK